MDDKKTPTEQAIADLRLFADRLESGVYILHTLDARYMGLTIVPSEPSAWVRVSIVVNQAKLREEPKP